ncbi:Hypothetical protein FKW44_022770 [Caligus rogercresseyi]|uniref:Uncharacterized protein n=1 Tax=Caligus rogercresseyi TaxID=217165 RepID=A0A7T8GNK2_CALRO|nr:Hypothetical protein FKW44_022770 [Caligus rogercresseyi]
MPLLALYNPNMPLETVNGRLCFLEASSPPGIVPVLPGGRTAPGQDYFFLS